MWREDEHPFSSAVELLDVKQEKMTFTAFINKKLFSLKETFSVLWKICYRTFCNHIFRV